MVPVPELLIILDVQNLSHFTVFQLLILGGARADAHREEILLLSTLLRWRDSVTLVLRAVSKGVLEHLTARRPLNRSDLARQLIIPSPLAAEAIASSHFTFRKPLINWELNWLFGVCCF